MGWDKILITVMLIFRHCVFMAYSEKLSDKIVFEKCELCLLVDWGICMEEAECNRREESKILTVLGYSYLSFKFIPYIEKQHSYRLLIAISSCCI